MRTKIIEVTNGPQNWGKFLIGVFDAEEWKTPSVVSPLARPLLRQIGWGDGHVFVLDLQTGEGAMFHLGGYSSAKYDLDKHKVWVCPLFEPFLQWLYAKRPADIADLPAHLDLPDATFSMAGYRRQGKADD